MIERILVPTDGSETARKAARYAYDLAALTKGEVVLLAVIDRTVFIGRPSVPASLTPTHIVEPLEDFLTQAADMEMKEIGKLGDRKGVATKMLLRYGHPVEEIVRAAEKSKADLIVMGSHGKSALSAALLGSVTLGVIHRDTKAPVLIVRR